jgi:hypothetical protein
MSRYIPVAEAIKVAMLGNGDILQRAKGRYLTWSKYVFEDLNLQTLKVAKRELLYINKRTNTVELPSDFYQLCSVNVMDKKGVIYPVYKNDRLHDDIVSVESMKDCACEYKCGYQLCNTIKGYEAVTTVKSDFMPNGNPISFTCTDRKEIDGQGFLYEETQYPERIYISGVWTNTILQTTQRKLCAIEVDKNGCICDTDKNIESVCNSFFGDNNNGLLPIGGTNSNPPHGNKNTNEWIYYCGSKMDWFAYQCGGFHKGLNHCNNIYNISELGDRLIFPNDFGYRSVLVRYYADVNRNDLQIPSIALDTFIAGIKWWDCRFDDKKQVLADHFEQVYSKLKWGLFLELNKYTISEQRMLLSPPVFVPSFIKNKSKFSGDWY